MVPAFLASGYHVNTDLPDRIRESGHRRISVARALGPDPVLAAVMAVRLREIGWCPGDAVVMAAAGSSDGIAMRDVRLAAVLLAAQVGEVQLGFVATGAPTVADMVTRLRAAGHRRVVIASYLLAPGVFHSRLSDCGADAVAAPLGSHPHIVGLLARRYFDESRKCLSLTG